MTDGVDLAKRFAHGHMPREQAAAHARLASLPTVRHSRTERDASDAARAAAETAERIRRTRLDRESAYNNAPPEFGQGAPKRGARQPAMSGRPQRVAILEALREGPMTVAQITERFSCTRATARISDLRDLGHVIECVRVDGVYTYRLIREAKR